MSSDDDTKPWDAPDPAQLRITTSPAGRRAKKNAPRTAGVSPSTAPPPPRLRLPGDLDAGSDPTEAPPPRPMPRPPRRPAARVGLPTAEVVPAAIKPVRVNPTEPVAVDAPPIPRPQNPFGAPPPAVVDTRQAAPRLSVGTGAEWREIEPTPSRAVADTPSVPRWALTAGSVFGIGALVLSGISVGSVVGSALIAAFTPVPENPDGTPVGYVAPKHVPTLRPAFPGGDTTALTGTDALIPVYPTPQERPTRYVPVVISLPAQTDLEANRPLLPPQNLVEEPPSPEPTAAAPTGPAPVP